MSPAFLHRVRLVLIACIAVLALPTSTLAAEPAFRDKIDFTGDVEICGVTGTTHVTGIQIGWETDDAFTATGQVSEVFTATDGRTVQFHVAGPYNFTFTDNGDGTATVTDTWTGMPESISGARGGPVSRDAGLITITTTFDLETEEVLSRDVLIYGPHPEADADFGLFCDAFLEALGE